MSGSRKLQAPVVCFACGAGPYTHERSLGYHIGSHHPSLVGTRAESLIRELALRYSLPPARPTNGAHPADLPTI